MKQLILSAATLSLILVANVFVVPSQLQAQDIERSLKAGACLDINNPNCLSDDAALGRINRILRTIVNLFSLAVGVISVIMIIIGGFRYITSGGDSANISSARNTIIYAIVGLVIVALSQVLVRFVLSRVTESNISTPISPVV